MVRIALEINTFSLFKYDAGLVRDVGRIRLLICSRYRSDLAGLQDSI